MRRETELGVDRDPVPALEVEPERLDERVALEACAPDERVRSQLLPRFELHPLRRDRLDHLPRRHLDPALGERLDCIVAELRLEHREDLWARLDQGDARRGLVDVRKVLPEVPGVELRERAGRLDARRPAAHDDDVQRAVVDQRGILVRSLPQAQNLVLQPYGVRERVERERVLRSALDTEEVDLRPEPEDEIVVAH